MSSMSEDKCRDTVRLNTITGTCKKCGTLTEFASPSLEYGGYGERVIVSGSGKRYKILGLIANPVYDGFDQLYKELVQNEYSEYKDKLPHGFVTELFLMTIDPVDGGSVSYLKSNYACPKCGCLDLEKHETGIKEFESFDVTYTEWENLKDGQKQKLSEAIDRYLAERGITK